jgi:D-glycero-alpha-D-manno-heptose-7-phosphate kinase
LRIEFAGGWADVPYIMHGKTRVCHQCRHQALIEYRSGKFNFSGYPRGSDLSTSTAVKLLEMISAKTYNAESKSLSTIAEDCFNLENKELNWAIGRQDQYGIVYGGVHCFESGSDYGKTIGEEIPKETLEEFRKHLVLLRTGISRNAQSAVEHVYKNHDTVQGQAALQTISKCGKIFYEALAAKEFMRCAAIMEENFTAQKQLASACTSGRIDAMYECAKANGAYGGKICGAGGGGAFIFYCKDLVILTKALKDTFVDCFEIDFEFEYKDIKQLNTL